MFCLTQPKSSSNSEFRRVSRRNRRKNPEKTTLTMLHTGEKPFHCSKCNYKSNNPTNQLVLLISPVPQKKNRRASTSWHRSSQRYFLIKKGGSFVAHFNPYTLHPGSSIFLIVANAKLVVLPGL